MVAEAISAAAALECELVMVVMRPGATWWAYAERTLFDRTYGSWYQQLDANNQVIETVWPGKSDLYHAVQATLIPQLPLAPTMATALAL